MIKRKNIKFILKIRSRIEGSSDNDSSLIVHQGQIFVKKVYQNLKVSISAIPINDPKEIGIMAEKYLDIHSRLERLTSPNPWTPLFTRWEPNIFG